MKLLDLAKFKKIDENKHTATMKHSDGHTMTILKSALPAIQREQLSRIPLYRGGDVQSFDEGTPDSPVQANSKEPTVEPVDPNDKENQSPVNHGTTNVFNIGAAAPAPQPQPVPVQAQPAPAAQTPVASTNPADIAKIPAQSANLGVQAANEQQKVSEEQAKGKIPIAQEQAKNVQDIQKRQQDTINDFKTHTDEYAQWLNANPQNSRRVLQNMSDEDKLGTSLGVFLGGIGTNNNQALNYLTNIINRDVDDQKTNADRKATVYGAYQHLYGDENASTALAKASMADAIVAKTNMLAARLGTPLAQANRDKIVSDMMSLKYNELQNAAGYSSAVAAPTAEQHAGSGEILNANAQQKYSQLLYDPTKTPEQKADLTKQYNHAVQTEKALKQINNLFTQLNEKATWGGYLSNKINPNAVGAVGSLVAGGLAAAAAPETGGATLPLVGAAAVKGGTAGEVVGHGAKAALRAIGGQQETQYQSAKASIISIIGSALAGANVTPTEVEKIAEQYTPTKVDSAASANDKLEKLKQKIIALTQTSALDAAGMTK